MTLRTAMTGLLTLAAACTPVLAIDAEHHARARDMADKAIAYLRSEQGPQGGWRHADDRPNFPAVSALAATGMLLDPRLDESDPDIAHAIDYVLSFRHPDGGIHDGVLTSYNTAICLSMLSEVRTPEAIAAIGPTREFLISLQYNEGFSGAPDSEDLTEPVSPDHPYYGGVGYGHHGRPDLSNVGFFVQALHDTGLSTEDDAYERALVFLSRVQMLDETNDFDYADGSTQGGFIYATVPNRESVEGVPGQSQAGEMDETLDDGTVASRLRSYGSMTYVGFKSLIYADLAPDDPRVVAARRWIEQNYTLNENPGLGDQGRYYYYLSLARALDAWGENEIAGTDWREALIDELASLQSESGAFTPVNDRWMESDPVLITAYALIALQVAMGNG
ncbi:MAG: hypothetical protein DHS20C14_21940 [Phycisphaeraceae bacterium]|nr:MAG: hypothetical protein DHS20C14_21940 [Phycisphaeraceae bacterium]